MGKEARLVQLHGGGLAPEGEGWFVVNARDAFWAHSDAFGLAATFENYQRPFEELGIKIHVLAPGQPNGMYHGENSQEDFLVLFGECLLLVEGEERPLEQWDFVHSPAGTQHIFVGAGDGPCGILMVGRRPPEGEEFLYPATELARRHNAGVEQETTSPDEAYAPFPEWGLGRFPEEAFPTSAS